MLTTLLFGFIGGALGLWGGWKIKQFIDDVRAPKVLPPSQEDQAIRQALNEGYLTDTDLEEIGIDPAKFKESQALVVFDENTCTSQTKEGLRCRNPTKPGVDRCWRHPHHRREPQVVVLREEQRKRIESRISIRTSGAYVDMETAGTGSLSVHVDGSNVSIQVGSNSVSSNNVGRIVPLTRPVPFARPCPVRPSLPSAPVEPTMSSPPTPPTPFSPPSPPTGGDSRVWSRYDREVSQHRRQLAAQERRHQQAIGAHARQVAGIERRHAQAIGAHAREVAGIERRHARGVRKWELEKEKSEAKVQRYERAMSQQPGQRALGAQLVTPEIPVLQQMEAIDRQVEDQMQAVDRHMKDVDDMLSNMFGPSNRRTRE